MVKLVRSKSRSRSRHVQFWGEVEVEVGGWCELKKGLMVAEAEEGDLYIRKSSNFQLLFSFSKCTGITVT